MVTEILAAYCALASGVMPAVINDNHVRTLTIRNADDFMLPPVIRLSTSDRLRMNFDIIGEDREYLRYRLVHCNSDWTPSHLLEHEYLEGFNEGEIDDYAFSSNTFTHFVNYNLELPAQSLGITKSGNYLIQVYREEEPEDILFQTGFYVTENSVEVSGEVTTRTDRGFNTDSQQLEITIDAAGQEITNLWQDYIVKVIQNNVPRSVSTALQPLRVVGSKAFYSHNPNLIFPAGNEYRRFETVRADYSGMGIDSVGFSDGIRRAWITPDAPRAGKSYIYDRTQHGRFKIDEYNSTDPDLGADYVLTRFLLQIPERVGKGVYVDGEFTLHSPDGAHKMIYDSGQGGYVLEIPLKQGSYNYRYVFGNEDEAKASEIEGDYYETENDYAVFVYLREPGSRGDRLISVTVY
ncbi:MAG: DUF5103 domain-containing protein [Muribaculaceae bacterium]|nr:DUF5103 domain-containing protein [Muribaculaceae bacterium]